MNREEARFCRLTIVDRCPMGEYEIKNKESNQDICIVAQNNYTYIRNHRGLFPVQLQNINISCFEHAHFLFRLQSQKSWRARETLSFKHQFDIC